jgi:hypothetical protein
MQNISFFSQYLQNIENRAVFLFFLAKQEKHSNRTVFFGNKCRTFTIALFFFPKCVEHSKLCSSVLCRGEKNAQEDKRKMRQTELDGGR